MHRTLAFLTVLAAPAAFSAQTVVYAPQSVQLAGMEPLPFGTVTAAATPVATLPDAPSSLVSSSASEEFLDGQAGVAPSAGNPNSTVASKYSGIILPGQTAVPLTTGNKIVYGFRDAFSPFSLVGITVSAGYSHLVDSQPHYGTNSEAFGKRVGVAALRSTVQALATDAVFSPIFRDDPRYYVLGRQHKFLSRVVYAGTRVLITRTDSGHNTLNAPLLLGYGTAAGLNNLYYPDRDTGAKSTLTGYAGSIGGAAIGMEINEFLDDALRVVHLRK